MVGWLAFSAFYLSYYRSISCCCCQLICINCNGESMEKNERVKWKEDDWINRFLMRIRLNVCMYAFVNMNVSLQRKFPLKISCSIHGTVYVPNSEKHTQGMVHVCCQMWKRSYVYFIKLYYYYYFFRSLACCILPWSKHKLQTTFHKIWNSNISSC